MTPEDFSVLAWWYTGVMRVVENRYRQAGFGTINAEIVGSFGGNSDTYRHPAFGVIWELTRHQYAEDFASWVDEALVPEVRSTLFQLDEWMLPEARDAQPRE